MRAAAGPSKLPVLKKKRSSASVVVVAPPRPYGKSPAAKKPAAVRRAPPSPDAAPEPAAGLTLVHLDGLPGSGKSYMS
eukprot:COSAG06_NODE_17419_length_942_cov_1.157770_2_plen_77_part_01